MKTLLHVVIGLMVAVAGGAISAPPLIQTAAPVSAVQPLIVGQDGLPAGALAARDDFRAGAAVGVRATQMLLAVAGARAAVHAPSVAEWVRVDSTRTAPVASAWLRPVRAPPSTF